jgi:hypothetical protein
MHCWSGSKCRKRGLSGGEGFERSIGLEEAGAEAKIINEVVEIGGQEGSKIGGGEVVSEVSKEERKDFEASAAAAWRDAKEAATSGVIKRVASREEEFDERGPGAG